MNRVDYLIIQTIFYYIFKDFLKVCVSIETKTGSYQVLSLPLVVHYMFLAVYAYLYIRIFSLVVY